MAIPNSPNSPNSNSNGGIKVWTSDDRKEWIEYATHSDSDREYRHGFVFNTMLRHVNGQQQVDNEDSKRVFATSCLARSIYGQHQHPAIKRLSLCFYKSVMQKISSNSFLNLMYNRGNFIVLVKGSNAYKMLLRHVPHDIDHSDLDVSIFINPNLTRELFEQIHTSMVVLVSQVMCRYKKDLDACLFVPYTHGNDDCILRPEHVSQFKEKYATTLANFHSGENDNGFFVSPFESVEARNTCSKRSFVIVNSAVKSDSVVRIEVPHLDRCEQIPLRKTPLVLSHNKTITFDRDLEGHHKAEFELIRLRLNNLFVFAETESTEGADDSRKHTIVPADFIDVSIPLQGDSELVEFWNTRGYNRCYEVFDKFVGTSIMVPNLNECIRELSNMLHVYTSSHIKQEKRQKRLDMFTQLDKSRKEAWALGHPPESR